MPYLPITVTQDDIDNGFRFDCAHCPVSRAINRVLAPKHAALVGAREGRHVMLKIVYGGRDITQWMHSITCYKTVDRFAAAFDRRESVQPFTFYLNLPVRLISPALLPFSS